MNIKRLINQNGKLIWYIIIIIVFVLLSIKSLNSYYEAEEERKKASFNENMINNNKNEDTEIENNENEYKIESNSIESTMDSFINYCNNREIDKAYKMLTEECKNVMFLTAEDFENKYIKNVFDEKKEYSMLNWYEEENMKTYQIKFIGNILATGETANITEDFYTFVKIGDIYKININNFINGKNINQKIECEGITVNLKNVNIYRNYEEYEISFTNNTSKEILLTGNKYSKNIYIENGLGTKYSSMNSVFDNNEVTLKPNNTKNYLIRFNKNYNPQSKVSKLVLSDVIWDYEEYLEFENKNDYTNRTSIKFEI